MEAGATLHAASQPAGGSVARDLLRLAAPTIAVLVVETMVGVAETFYVGRLGTDALAGAAYLHIAGSAYPFVGAGMLLYFASQGAGGVPWPSVAGNLRLVVSAGLGTLLVHRFHASLGALFADGVPKGVNLSMQATWFISTVFVPLLLCTHAMLYLLLLRRRASVPEPAELGVRSGGRTAPLVLQERPSAASPEKPGGR